MIGFQSKWLVALVNKTKLLPEYHRDSIPKIITNDNELLPLKELF